MFVIKKETAVKINISNNYSAAINIAAENLKRDIKNVFDSDAYNTEDVADIYIRCLDEDIVINDTSDICSELYELLPKKIGGYYTEGFVLVVKNNSLYIIGKDRRGTIYGIYELSEMIGVSPWYFWGDVPVHKKNSFELPDNFIRSDYPMVEFRGIFLNDEEELENWARQHTHDETIGYETYSHIFELILRLKANYIWPAMHVDYFNRDSRLPWLANEMGVIVGTSHCDMLLRSNQNEWSPWLELKGYQNARYDYSLSDENRRIIDEYWDESVINNKDYDVTYTIGMRGIHDSGFVTEAIDQDDYLTENERFEAKKKLLEKVMNRQEEILSEHVDNPVEIFIPYKEVLDLYNKGLKVPENATLVWVDDNFGYMRRFPNEEEQKRSGGNGLYYHASYWAHPGMSYLFFNSEPLQQMEFELTRSWDEGIRKLWILNVGALKPLEIDTAYFTYLAWNVGKKEYYSSQEFLKNWLNKICSVDMSEAADIYLKCMQMLHVRRLEHMDNDIFSIENGEALHRLNILKEYAHKGREIYDKLPESEKNAFYQMVLFKLEIAVYVNETYYHSDKSRYMYDKLHSRCCDDEVVKMKKADELKRCLLYYYNNVLSNGKWNGIVTPESFSPPPMAMHPDARVYVDGDRVITTDSHEQTMDGIVLSADNFSIEGNGFRIVEGLGYGSGCALCAYGASEKNSVCASVSFKLEKDGSYDAEIFRYVTLNQMGEISCTIQIDDGEVISLNSLCTDEWRPGWRESVLINCEKMRFKLPYLNAGEHILKIQTNSKYYTFSKIGIYDKGWFYNYMGPYKYDKDTECTVLEADIYYSKFAHKLKPLPMLYADSDFWKINRLYVISDSVEQSSYGTEKKYITKINESEGKILFDASLALNNTDDFFVNNIKGAGEWKQIYAESDNQNGIAMRLEGSKPYWNDDEDAPSLNYKININHPGKYYVWLLVKFNEVTDDACRIGVNGYKQKGSEQFSRGNLFTYSMQQRWNWNNISIIDLPKGDNTFTIYGSKNGFRVNKIYLTQTKEIPGTYDNM